MSRLVLLCALGLLLTPQSVLADPDAGVAPSERARKTVGSTDAGVDPESDDRDEVDADAGDLRAVKGLAPRSNQPTAEGTRPIDGEALEAEPIDGEALEAEPIDGEALEAEPIDGEALEAEPIDGEALEAAPIDGEALEAAPSAKAPVPTGGTDQTPATGRRPDETEPTTPERPRDDGTLDTITIVGTTGGVKRVAGSAHLIGETALEESEYDDVHRVLSQVPGVYVRDEDGFGLRPNIGLRGANSDRSAKVTLMEDGVLLAPAPYAAPAAYYFPLTTRLESLEVFKGPASIQYGPNTIGGALNMITRPAPGKGAVGRMDLAFGQRRGEKLHGFFGQGWAHFGYVVEGALIGSDGFKTLDGGGGTGFDKYELMLKLRANNDLLADVHQRLELKLGYSDERSYETYLGLSQADFEATPYRRYAASQLGLMEWGRTQVKLAYTVLFGEALELRVTAYRHDFDRAWQKLNDFVGAAGVRVADVLGDPGSRRHQRYFGILTGDHDWTGDAAERLAIGTNQRVYVSQGVQLISSWRVDAGWLASNLQAGLRLHADQIERHHTEGEYDMVQGRVVRVTEDELTASNTGEAAAISAYLFDELVIAKRLTLTPGLRVEVMSTGFEDVHAGTARTENASQILLPGLGAWYAFDDHWGALLGAHRGFSPVAPGQDDAAEPEVSTSYEAGVRWQYPTFNGELIGFLNQYENLVGTCTQSAGCDLDVVDQQFNAGEATIYGVEAVVGGSRRGLGGRLSANLVYTLTVGRFDGAFESGFGQWGQVEAGDVLPYVPEHQGALRLGYETATWGLTAALSHVGEMRDSAGQGPVDAAEKIGAHTVLDAAAHLNFHGARVYVTVDNVLDEAYLASRRPLGLRPGKPRQGMAGLKIGL